MPYTLESMDDHMVRLGNHVCPPAGCPTEVFVTPKKDGKHHSTTLGRIGRVLNLGCLVAVLLTRGLRKEPVNLPAGVDLEILPYL